MNGWPANLVLIPGGRRDTMGDTEALVAYTTHQKMRGLSDNHRTHSRRELLILQRFIDVPLLNATHQDLMEWAASIEQRCNAGSRYVKLSRIHSFYEWAHAEGLIDRIPTARIPRPKVPQGIPRPTPKDEVQRAFEAAEGEMRLWLMLAALAGFRCCEIARLTRDQILDTATPPYLRPIGKGNKPRIVYLCDELLAEIRAYPLPTRGWVFKRRDGKPGAPTAALVSIYGNQFLHGVGVRETMHQLRHRFGTDVYAASDLPTTASQLGHSNLQTSRGYAQLNDAAAAKAVQSLGFHPQPIEAA